jgi:uncharacterized protein
MQMNREEALANLEKALRASNDIPGLYMFKFIIPNDNQKRALAMALFDDSGTILTKESENGKYVSITSKEVMLTVEAIMEKYRLALQIEGLIIL